MPRRSSTQLNREIAEVLQKGPLHLRHPATHACIAIPRGQATKERLHHALRSKTTRVHIGPGRLDGIGSIAANYRLRSLRQLGATNIKLARTGRLTFTHNGQNYDYRVTAPRNRGEADYLESQGLNESPLSRALKDIRGTSNLTAD